MVWREGAPSAKGRTEFFGLPSPLHSLLLHLSPVSVLWTVARIAERICRTPKTGLSSLISVKDHRAMYRLHITIDSATASEAILEALHPLDKTPLICGSDVL